MADIFLSYARADQAKIEKLAAALEEAGYSLWWDKHIKGGKAFGKDIEAAIAEAKAVIVAWSAASVQSEWVLDEASYGRDNNKLVPVRLDDIPPPMGYRQRQAVDFSSGMGNAQSIAALVAALDDLVGSEHEGPAPAAPRSARILPRWAIVAIPLLLLLAAFGWWALERTPDAASTAASGAQDERQNSVAVLPFVLRTSEDDDRIFAEGMHDDLLTQLAKISGLRVISRTSMLQYAGTQKPIPTIAEELGVAAVLEGALQRAGDRVRINVQLIDGRTDEHLWAETFDRELTTANLFEIQSEISRAIADRLGTVLSAVDRASLDQIPTDNLAAYEAYLKGKALSDYNTLSRTDFDSAADAFGEAVALDPDFAEAWAGKARAHITLYWWRFDRERNARLNQEAIDRLAALAPDSAAIFAARGERAYRHDGDYEAALTLLQQSIDRNANDATVWITSASAARRAGRFDLATSDFRRALQISPRDADAMINLADILGLTGKHEEARRQLAQARSLDPGSGYPALIAQQMAMYEGDREGLWQAFLEQQRFSQVSNGASIAWDIFTLSPYIERPDRLREIVRALDRALQPDEGNRAAPAFAIIVRSRLGAHIPLDRTIAMIDRRMPDAPLASVAAVRALARAGAGDREGALREVRLALANEPKDRLWLSEAGMMATNAAAQAGDIELALDLVEQAMDRYSPTHFARYRLSNAFDPYRDHSRYKALERRYLAWKKDQR